MDTVNLYEAKTQLSALVERAGGRRGNHHREERPRGRAPRAARQAHDAASRWAASRVSSVVGKDFDAPLPEAMRWRKPSAARPNEAAGRHARLHLGLRCASAADGEDAGQSSPNRRERRVRQRGIAVGDGDQGRSRRACGSRWSGWRTSSPRWDSRPLSMTMPHALEAGGLPRHHDDPFDRMLIAQARLDGLALVTLDRQFSRYDVPIFEG